MKIGDKVRCIKSSDGLSDIKTITVNKIYEIYDIKYDSFGIGISLKNDRGNVEWFYIIMNGSGWFELYNDGDTELKKEIDYFKITRECSMI